MSAITDEIHKLVAELELEGHHLADGFRAALAKLRGDKKQLATEAHADEMQVAQDAEPVVKEAESDAKNLETEAIDDAKDLTAPAVPVEPPATPAA